MPKVLIIEDNDVALSTVRAGLNDPAWELLFATDGERGLELALRHLQTLNALVLDLFLPKIDGRAIIEHVRALRPNLPIIVVSNDVAALEELRTHTMTITLRKPVSSKQYTDVLHAVIPRNGTPADTRTPAERRSFDRTPVQGMHILDLDLNRVEQHIRNALERRRYDGPTEWEPFLLDNGGAIRSDDRLLPTVAGVLAFAARPERWLYASGVDVAEFTGETTSTTLRTQQQIRGNVFTVIERTVDLLWARIDHASPIDPAHGPAQAQFDAYPYIVLRELTINALCHRDWSVEGSVIRIQIFPNRIEWINPGGLPPGVRVEELRYHQLSRNPALAQLLYQVGVIERFGLGIDRVLDALQQAGHPPPEMIDQGHSFLVRVFGVSLDKRIPAPSPSLPVINERQRAILDVLGDDREHQTSEVAGRLGYSISSAQRDLNFLIGLGMVEATGSARARRYRRKQ